MNDRQYFMTTSLSYQLKAAQQELASFRSGEIYVKLRADYETIIRNQNITIQKLRKERDDVSFSRKAITRQWMEVLEDVHKECKKETKKRKQVIAELLDMVASLKKRNSELDENRKKALKDSCEVIIKLEDAQGLIAKLTAQANHNYENLSLPSSKCIDRKKITNNREKTGKRQGKNRVPSQGIHTIHVNPWRSVPGILSKSKQEQDGLFKALLDTPVMHVDGTVARVNGNNKNVVVCSNGFNDCKYVYWKCDDGICRRSYL